MIKIPSIKRPSDSKCILTKKYCNYNIYRGKLSQLIMKHLSHRNIQSILYLPGNNISTNPKFMSFLDRPNQ